MVASILVALSSDEGFELGVITTLRSSGFHVRPWKEREQIGFAADLVVAGTLEMELVGTLQTWAVPPQILTVVSVADVRGSRSAIRAGAAGVIERPCAMEKLVEVVTTCLDDNSTCPPHILAGLADRLEEPPRPLNVDEERFLALAMTLTIEQVGEQVGLSRRQAQRRFKTLCDTFGFKSRTAAATAAARWGLSSIDAT